MQVHPRFPVVLPPFSQDNSNNGILHDSGCEHGEVPRHLQDHIFEEALHVVKKLGLTFGKEFLLLYDKGLKMAMVSYR